uniref:Uncharacterized protein n=1 Tax=Anguilla anguilla TaxID=7936 RepID=A0A0E9T7E4_ANGAN
MSHERDVSLSSLSPPSFSPNICPIYHFSCSLLSFSFCLSASSLLFSS